MSFEFQNAGAAFLADGGVLLADSPGLGKLHPIDCKIMAPGGWRVIGDLRVDDLVTGSDGRPTRVVGVYPQGVKPIYRVIFSDHSSVEAGAEHLWTVEHVVGTTSGGRKVRRIQEVLTTEQLRTHRWVVNRKRGGSRFYLPMLSGPVQFTAIQLPMPAYLVGQLIANGGLANGACVLVINAEDESNITARLRLLGQTWRRSQYVSTVVVLSFRDMLPTLRSLDMCVLSRIKRLPGIYLRAEPSARIALLQGLMDGDGSISQGRNRVRYHTTSARLADDVRELVEGLGGIASVGRYERTDGKPTDYQVRIRLPKWVLPFSTSPKADRYAPGRSSNPCRTVVSVEYSREAEAVCIAVDAEDSLYVTEHCILTHNTRQALMAAQQLGARTILIQCPAIAVGVWQAEIAKWRPDLTAVPARQLIKRRSKLKRQLSCVSRLKVALIMSYDHLVASQALRDHVARLAPFDLLILDECFPAGTMVSTPTGDRAIETIVEGDVVHGYDHAAGKVRPTMVRHTFCKASAAPLVEVAGVCMTWNHPVWTRDRGYVIAIGVRSSDLVGYTDGKNLRTMRADLRQQRPVRQGTGEAALLQPFMRLQIQDDADREGVRAMQNSVHRLARPDHMQCALSVPPKETAAATSTPREGMPSLRRRVQIPHEEAGMLLLRMCGEIEVGAPSGVGGAYQGTLEGNSGSPGSAGEGSRPPALGSQPVSRPGGPGQVATRGQEEGLGPFEWGQWAAGIDPTAAAGGSPGLVHGGNCTNEGGTSVRLPDVLQNRRGRAELKGGYRGRWRWPQGQESPPPRSEENRPSGSTRLADHASVEHGGVEQPARGLTPDRVYNLETGTGNYFAGGLLVHNCHALKNPTTKRAIYTYGALCAGGPDSLIGMCGRTILLTGTPQLNGAHELFTHLRALAPERIVQSSYEAFVTYYCHRGVRTVRTNAHAGRPSRTIQIETITGTNRTQAPELASRMRGFWLRRTTEQVMAELPPLRVEVRLLPVEMLDGDLLAEATESDEATELAAAVASGDPERLRDLEGHMARLRKLLAMAKVDAAVQWALGALDAGEPKVAVWGWHVDALKKVRDALTKAVTKPIMIIGATTGRDALVERFQTDPTCKAGVFQIQAAGTALTMTACRRAIFLEQAWTPALNHQAIKRHHRIGTTNPVLAEILVAPGLDEIVGQILARKSADIAAVEDGHETAG